MTDTWYLASSDSTTGLSALRAPVLLLATVLAGLQAGTYYTWATGVMPGLARVDDHGFVSTLQHINVAIVNPVFMLSFFGAPLVAAVAVATSGPTARPWTVAALVLALGTVVVTVAANVPLNDALAAAGPVDRIADLGAAREHFEGLWTRWNVVRTLTSTGALACLTWAALRPWP
ncbi:MAG: anthrone oxygenase family protein [Nocardioidaceae bacterium]